MKRPITILCLADLHLVDQQSPIFVNLRKSIKDLMYKNPIWRPDFLAIAGDMVEAKNRQYNLVKDHINSFIKDNDFHLDPFRFIATPGNHDKDFPFTGIVDKKEKQKSVIREKRKYKSFVSSFDKESSKFSIKESFGDNFKSFGSFYEDYVQVKATCNAEYIYPVHLLGGELKDVALTSGMKVFHDAKICFLTVNTEWVYLPSDSKTDSGLKKICPQVVFWLIDLYSKKYRDYALVTVMHRSPYELSWTEKNMDSSNRPDILRYIYQYSDVILSGHDHIQKVLPPHMMENKAQLFPLGSASMGNRGQSNQFVRYLATLIHLDVVEGTVRVCRFRYSYSERGWKCMEDKMLYPLSSRLALESEFVNVYPAMGKDTKNYLRVLLKSTEQEDIKDVIRACHPGLEPAGYSIVVHNINKDGLASTVKDVLSFQNRVAAFVYTHSDEDHKRFYKLKDSLLEDEELREAVYLKRLIIKELCYSLSPKKPIDTSEEV